MSERLFSFYNDELGFIREEVREFEGRFAKVAARLRLSADSVEAPEDPHVARLIDSFALLNARLRLKIEDEFPEICQTMLQALYPQYLAPVPSASICQFELDEVGGELTQGFQLKRGTQVETDEIDSQICYFRTCFDLELFPLKVIRSEYVKPPFSFPTDATWSNSVEAAIRIDLAPISRKMDWQKTNISRLRFFLGGSSNCGNHLCEALLRDALGVGLFSSRNKEGVFLSRNSISQAGFETDQGLLDHDPRTLSAYQTIWEFFAIPEKFRFIEIEFGSVWNLVAGDNLSIVVFLKKQHPIIQRHMTKDAILLGCTPVVNLFEKEAEPIALNEKQVEYRVIPSYRTATGMEVHSVKSVTSTRPGGEEDLTFLPFHRPSHQVSSAAVDRYWHASRRRRIAGDVVGDRGTEVFLTIVDLHSRPKPSDEWTLHVKAVCCNRDLVSKLGIQSRLHFTGGPCKVAFRTSPTPTRRPIDRDDWIWRLVSHLSLNHLTLASDSDGQLLREILGLYNSNDQEEILKAVDSIGKISYKRSTARIPDTGKGPGICRGIDILLQVDEERLEGIGAFLFASVLDEFFSVFATINSFTRLTVYAKGGNQMLYEGKARSGTKFLM